MPAGAPTTYNEDIATEICTLIAEGNSLRKIAAMEGMPTLRTIMNWLNRHDEFVQQYARAKESQADAYEELMLEVARTEKDVQRARLIVDTMKWTASKLKPKKYGDKVDYTTNGKDLPTPILGGLSKQDEVSRDDSAS
jgi:hypothetical protein